MPLVCPFASAQEQLMVVDTVFDRSKYEDQFAFGADISWLSQQESWGTVYNNRAGRKTDLMTILKDEEGINAVRFRVWVNPGGGWSGKQDVINLCKRANAKGLKIMIDFHYSDTWADPGSQTVPAEWASDMSVGALSQRVYDHTYDILNSLKQTGITPRWVQIGNETKRGMLWETGRTNSTQGYKNFAALINSGYKAIKDVDQSILAIVHLPDGHDNGLYRSMFDKLRQYGAKWDIIGMSAYPRWSHLDVSTDANIRSSINKYLTNIRDMKSRYGTPVMIVETGHHNDRPKESNNFLAEFMKSLISAGALGCFYWEPEAMSGYALGAWDPNTKQASIAMDAYKGLKYVNVDKYVEMSMKTPIETVTLPNGAGVDLCVNALPGSKYTSVTKVEFYLNKRKKGTVTECTPEGDYHLTPDSLEDGAYNFYTVAYDSQGNKQISDTISFLVGDPLMLDENSVAWSGVADGKGGVESVHPDYTGTGYITSGENKEAKTMWKVHFPEAGRYIMAFRYASTSNVYLTMYLNGVRKSAIPLTGTGLLNKWTIFYRLLTINEAGTYTLDYRSSASSPLPNIDYVAVFSPNKENPAAEVIVPDGPNDVRQVRVDGQQSGGAMYDLQGRRITVTPSRIYIKDGKKHIDVVK